MLTIIKAERTESLGTSAVFCLATYAVLVEALRIVNTIVRKIHLSACAIATSHSVAMAHSSCRSLEDSSERGGLHDTGVRVKDSMNLQTRPVAVHRSWAEAFWSLSSLHA